MNYYPFGSVLTILNFLSRLTFCKVCFHRNRIKASQDDHKGSQLGYVVQNAVRFNCFCLKEESLEKWDGRQENDNPTWCGLN